MTISAAMVGEVRTGGSDSNSGFFKSTASGTDRTLQDSAYVTIDGTNVIATVHTTTTQLNITGLAGFAVQDPEDVGNTVRITGGTATQGLYEITVADEANNRWTLDRSAGTAAQTGTGTMGGALASPGLACAGMSVAGMKTWVKSGTYSISSSSSNVSGGRMTLGTSNTQLQGYQTTRGDETGTRPLFQATTNTMTLVTLSNDVLLANVELTAASATGIQGTNAGSQALLYKVKMNNANATCGFQGAANTCHILCEATGGTVSGFLGQGGHFIGCVASGIAQRGFNASNNDSVFIRCISIGNTGGTGKGFDLSTATGEGVFVNCVAKGNAQTGFDNSAAAVKAANYINCISYDNSTNGFIAGHCWNCAAGANDTADYGATVVQHNCVTLTGDPFTNAGSGDYSLNNTAGAGADCRGVGIPGVFPPLVSSTGYPDIGAVQHQAVDTTTNIYKSAVGRFSF